MNNRRDDRENGNGNMEFVDDGRVAEDLLDSINQGVSRCQIAMRVTKRRKRYLNA